MKINFRTEYIVPELKSAQGFEAIDELTNHLASVGAILPEHRSEIAAVIKQREYSMSTGIGCGVALPHALSHLVEETIVAFGRSKAGIDFDTLDREPVRLVAMIIVPAGARESSLKTLAAISRLLHKTELCRALELAADSAMIADILNGRAIISTTAAVRETSAHSDYS